MNYEAVCLSYDECPKLENRQEALAWARENCGTFYEHELFSIRYVSYDDERKCDTLFKFCSKDDLCEKEALLFALRWKSATYKDAS